MGLLTGERPAEAAKVLPARHRHERRPADDNPAFYFYLAGALALAERTDEALAAARRRPREQDRRRPASTAARPGCCYIAKRYDEADRRPIAS